MKSGKSVTFLTALVFTCFLPASGWGQTDDFNLLTTNSPFVLYMQNPPWIKEMYFAKNYFVEEGSTPGQITKKEWVNATNRLAIQPSGMFYEPSILVLPGDPALPLQRVVKGISDHYYWDAEIMHGQTMHGQSLALSSRRPEEGGTDTNHLQLLLEALKNDDINPARFLGFPPLLTNSFHLIDNDKFAAITAESEPVEGEILDASDNRPLKLKYALNGNTNNYVSIIYKYETAGELPDYFERREPGNRRKYARDLTNWIVSASYGVDSKIQNGYSPSMFFSNLSIFTHIVIESNGMRYDLKSEGGITPANEKYVPLDEIMGRAHHKLFTSMTIIIFLVGCGFFIWKVSTRSGN